MELVVLPVTASVIDCTGQVVKSRGWLVTLLLLAKSDVMPGVCAVTLTCPVTSPATGALSVAIASVATSALTDCQVNGPTLAGDVQPAAEGGGLVVEGLALGKAWPGGRGLVRDRADHDLVDVLMHVHRGGRAADPVRRGGHLGHSDRAGSADLRRGQRIPGAGAGQSVGGDGQDGGIAGKKRNRSGDGVCLTVLGGRGEGLGRAAHVERNRVGGRRE